MTQRLDTKGIDILEQCADRGVREYHPSNVLDLCELAREALASREQLAFVTQERDRLRRVLALLAEGRPPAAAWDAGTLTTFLRSRGLSGYAEVVERAVGAEVVERAVGAEVKP
jgi:hypothetical protein